MPVNDRIPPWALKVVVPVLASVAVWLVQDTYRGMRDELKELRLAIGSLEREVSVLQGKVDAQP